MTRSNVDVDCVRRAARAWARSRCTLSLGVSPGLPFPPTLAATPSDDVVVDFDVDCELAVPDFMPLGIRYGAVFDDEEVVEDAFLELTYGPVAVNLVASAADRDM